MDGATPRPERLGQYEIVETLALGLKWRIFKGFEPILRRSVALKATSKILDSSGAATVTRFQNGARAAAHLNYPGIAGVYRYGEELLDALDYVHDQGVLA